MVSLMIPSMENLVSLSLVYPNPSSAAVALANLAGPWSIPLPAETTGRRYRLRIASVTSGREVTIVPAYAAIASVVLPLHYLVQQNASHIAIHTSVFDRINLPVCRNVADLELVFDSGRGEAIFEQVGTMFPSLQRIHVRTYDGGSANMVEDVSPLLSDLTDRGVEVTTDRSGALDYSDCAHAKFVTDDYSTRAGALHI